jgi:hypothetical protein
MIGWTKLVGNTAWIMMASLACAGATPKASTPRYFRSPPLDYVDAPRSASDGEVLGAQRQPPDDWMLGNPTNLHAAPGWSVEYGQLRFRQERAVAGRGVMIEAIPCEPPDGRVLAPDEVEERAALQRAWLETVREPSLPVLASNVGAVAPEQSVLSCNRQ